MDYADSMSQRACGAVPPLVLGVGGGVLTLRGQFHRDGAGL